VPFDSISIFVVAASDSVGCGLLLCPSRPTACYVAPFWPNHSRSECSGYSKTPCSLHLHCPHHPHHCRLKWASWQLIPIPVSLSVSDPGCFCIICAMISVHRFLSVSSFWWQPHLYERPQSVVVCPTPYIRLFALVSEYEMFATTPTCPSFECAPSEPTA